MPRTWPETQRSKVTEVRTPEGTNDQPWVYLGGHGARSPAHSAPGPARRGHLPRGVDMGERSRNSPP